MKRLIAWFLTLAMVIGMMPVQALAEETESGYDPNHYYLAELISAENEYGETDSIGIYGNMPSVNSSWYAGYDSEYYVWDHVTIDSEIYYFTEAASIVEGNTGSVALTTNAECSVNKLEVYGDGYSMPTAFYMAYADGSFVLSWEPIQYMTVNYAESSMVGINTTMGNAVELTLESEQAISIQYKGEEWGVPAGEDYSIGYRPFGKISEGATAIVLPAGRYLISAQEWFPSREFTVSVTACREYAVRNSAGNLQGVIQKDPDGNYGVMTSYFAEGVYEIYYTEPTVSEGVCGCTSATVEVFEIGEAGEYWVCTQGFRDTYIAPDAVLSVVKSEEIDALDNTLTVDKADNMASVYRFSASVEGYYEVQFTALDNTIKWCLGYPDGTNVWGMLWNGDSTVEVSYMEAGDSFDIILFPNGVEEPGYTAQVRVSEHQHTDIDNGVCTECGMQMAASVLDYVTYETCFFESLEDAFEDALQKNQEGYVQIDVYQSGEYLEDIVLENSFYLNLHEGVELRLKSIDFSGDYLYFNEGTVVVEDGITIGSEWKWCYIQNQCHVIADITCESGNVQIMNATLEGDLSMGEYRNLYVYGSVTLYFDPSQYLNNLDRFYITHESDAEREFWTVQEYSYVLVLADGSELNNYTDGQSGYYDGTEICIDHLVDIFGNILYPIRNEANGLCHTLYFSMDPSERLSPIQTYDYTYITFSINDRQPVMKFTRYMEYKQGEDGGWNWLGIDNENETFSIYGPEMFRFRLGEELLVPVDENGNIPTNISGSGRYALVPYDEATMMSDYVTLGEGNYRAAVNSDDNGNLVLVISKILNWEFEILRASDGQFNGWYYGYWDNLSIDQNSFLNCITINGEAYYPSEDATSERGRVELSPENRGCRVTFVKGTEMNTIYWLSLTEQSGTYFFEWKKAPSVNWNGRPFTLGIPTLGFTVEEDTESAIEYDGKLYGIRKGDSIQFNEMVLVEYEDGSTEAGSFIVPAGEYRLNFEWVDDSLHMYIRPKYVYELYDQDNIFIVELEAETANTVSDLAAGTYSVKVVKAADNGDELRETIITGIVVAEEGDYVITLSQVEKYYMFDSPSARVEKRKSFTENEQVSIFVDKGTTSSTYFFRPERNMTGILHVSSTMEGEYRVQDSIGNFVNYMPSGNREYRFRLSAGQELGVRFSVNSIADGEGADITFWVEEVFEWNMEVSDQWGDKDTWSSNGSVFWIYSASTINYIEINGEVYYPVMNVRAGSGSVVLQQVSNDSRITILGEYQEIMPLTSIWVTREEEGYVLHWEKQDPVSIDGELFEWNESKYVNLQEPRPLTIEWKGELYGVRAGQRLDSAEISLVKMTEENAVPVSLPPEKYLMYTSIGRERQPKLTIRYAYTSYLKNADGERIGDIAGEYGLGTEVIPAGTYELWGVRAETILNQHQNTGITITVPDNGIDYGVYLGQSAISDPQWATPRIVRLVNVGNGSRVAGTVRYGGELIAYQYTADKDTPVTFEVNASEARAILATLGKQITQECWGMNSLTCYLKAGETATIMLEVPYPSYSGGNYSIQIEAGCKHRDDDRDGSCDLCGTQLAVRMTISGYGQWLFETFEEAMAMWNDLSNTSYSFITLLGADNEYVYDGQLVLNNCQDLYIDMGGNSLTVTGGIVLNDSNMNVYGDFDETLEDTILNADITICQSPDTLVGESDLWNLTYNGTITLEARAENSFISITLLDGVFNGNIIAQPKTHMEIMDGAVVNADIQASYAHIIFDRGSVMHGMVTCPDAENTNFYDFNRGLFGYSPDSLINPEYQVVIQRTIDGETYYQPSGVLNGDVDPEMDVVLDQLIEMEEISVNLLEPVITSNDAAGLSLTIEKNGSCDQAADAIYAARNATLKVVLDELLAQIGGYDDIYDEEIREWVTTASLLDGTVEIESLLKINESSEVADNGRVRYDLETSIQTTLVYTDAQGNSMVMTWDEPLITLNDPDVIIKMQLPAALDTENGVANGLYVNGELVYVTKADIIEENNKQIAISDLGLVTGAYTFLGAGEPVKVWNDQQEAYTVPSDVTFDYVGQHMTFDMAVQPVLDGTMDGEDVQIGIFPCDDVFDYGEGTDTIMPVKVGSGVIMFAAIHNNEIIAWSMINGTVERNVAQIDGCSLTLDGKIGLNFYLDIPENILTLLGDDAYVDLRRGFVTEQHVLLSEARHSGDLYKFTTYVAAKELHDTISLWLYDGDGRPYMLYGKNGELCSKGFRYTVAKYCEEAMYRGSEKLAVLADELLSYGNQTQNYFGYKTDTIDYLYNYPSYDLSEFAVEYDNTLEMVNYWGSSLLLKEGTILRHYFKFEEDIQNYQITVDGEAVELVQKGETYYLDIDGIAAQNLGDMYTVSITRKNAEGELTLTYGPFSYAKDAMKKNNDMRNLMMSMYHYYRAALAYFND